MAPTGALRIVGILHAAAFLRDLLAVLPVAEVLAVGRPLDRREIRLLDALRDVLRQRLARVLAARLLRLVLVEAVELRLALLLERRLQHRGGLGVELPSSVGPVAQPTRIAANCGGGDVASRRRRVVRCRRCMAAAFVSA